MKVAITGGTGLVGYNVAAWLAERGHEVVLVARGHNHVHPAVPGACRVRTGVDAPEALARAFAGCEAVVHCAGINRELGTQTYERVHRQGTRNVVDAARKTGVRKLVLLSFLRARPNCGSGYHESKWHAEELVRKSGLDYTILKCGVIYGRGDHMLDHLSHAFYTFPLFGLVGFRDKPIRPNAVEDVARIIGTCVVKGALSRQTVPVLGPEELTLRQAVQRVAQVVGRQPLMVPLPSWFHYLLGWCLERLMHVPMVSVAQVRILSEGLAEAAPPCDRMPAELAPRIPFSEEQIRKGLPPPGPFRLRDVRCCRSGTRRAPHKTIVFFETP